MSKSLPFEGVLLVSDMDGTLITRDFSVPERNIEAIDRFIEKGGRFTLATGRSAASAGKYITKVKINAPSILSNGSSIYDLSGGKILWNTALPMSVGPLVETVIERFPDVGVELYIDEQIYIVNRNKWTERHIINEGFSYVETSLKDAPHGWQKVLFACENERLCEIDDYIRSLKVDICDFVFSSLNYYEALPKGVSKGTALKKLAEMLGIEYKNTVGIGDYYNDATLVKMAGIGVTVEGAPQELVDAAQFVTGPCENGAVADLIEYLEDNPTLFQR